MCRDTLSQQIGPNAGGGCPAQASGMDDFMASLAMRIGTLICGIGIQSLLAYTLLPEGRGAYAVCVLFATLLGILLTPGVDAGSQHFVMTKNLTASQAGSVSLVISLVGSGAVMALAVPLIRSDIVFFRKAEPASFYVALALVPCVTFGNAVQHLMAGLRRFRRLAVYSLLQIAANGLALVLLVWGLGAGVRGALLASCMGNLVMIFLSLRHLRKAVGLRWETPTAVRLMKVLRYGLKYHIARIGSGVDARVGVLLLGLVAQPSEVGLFAVASGVMMNCLVISRSVLAPLLPRTAADEDGRADLVAFGARMATWMTAVVLVGLTVLAVPVVGILFSPAFLDAVPLIKLIAPGILAFAGGNVLTAFFRGVNRPDICSVAVVVGIATNLVVVLLAYPHVGVAAGGWGMTCGLIVRTALLSAAYYRASKSRLGVVWLPQRGDLQRVMTLARKALGRVR